MHNERIDKSTGIFVAKQLIGETIDEQSASFKHNLPNVSSRTYIIK